MVRLPRPLVEQIRTIAEAHDRSISAELRVALDAYVRRTLPEAERTLNEKMR
jgi:predicted transcriptional regulator